nr:glycosyltransferase family 4 protein [Geodermatophilaceae bacterium]
MRLAVYCDYSYRRDGDELWAELSVVRFIARLARSFDAVTLLGRLEPEPGRWAYLVPSEVDFVPLADYPSLARPGAAAGAFAASARRFWRALGAVDVVWLLGPHPLAMVFAVLARVRGRHVVLGVRQDLPAYVRNRHPDRPFLQLAAVVLEAGWRLLSLTCPVVVVGPDLARRYRRAPRRLSIAISVVPEADIMERQHFEAKRYDGELRVLSVGRLEAEKNPMLMAEVMAELNRDGRAWRLTVCGDGPLQDDLRMRIADLGLSDRVDLLGFVSLDEGLLDLYRSSHLFLHCSWTEGMPQVLLEAFAARLPVIATAVGGVPDAAAGAAELVPPGDARAAA